MALGFKVSGAQIEDVYQSYDGINLAGSKLLAWGRNSDGQLGLGDITHRSSPVQVGALTNWKQISAGPNSSAAIKTDGTLWTWGWNSSGALGLGDTTFRSSPVQVGALTNWKQVSVGGDQFMLAVRTDGSLWGWGNNQTGYLGVSTATTAYSNPIQVGSLTTWTQTSAGYDSGHAIQTG